MNGDSRMKMFTTRALLALGSLVSFAGGVYAQPTSAPEDANQWHIETVDTAGAGRFTSLKVDKSGNVQVAYVIEDGSRYPLKYAIRTAINQRWFTMTIASGAGPCSLVLDSQQKPHVSWDDYGSLAGARLRQAYWDGTNWKADAINLNSEVISYYNSIALDPADNPAIVFYEYQGPQGTDYRIRLRSVIWNGKAWDLRTVDPEPGSGKFNSMVADKEGHLHVAYANVSAVTAGIRYAFWDGRAWKTEIIEGMERTGGNSVGYSAAIALDGDGNPHITYMDETSPRVKYAVRKKGQWHIQGVESLAAVAYPDRNSIAISDKGIPYIGYYDSARKCLKLAHLEGSRWMIETVDGNGAGFTSSLDIHDGTIWISYSDENGSLKVAHRKLNEPQTAASALVSAKAERERQ